MDFDLKYCMSILRNVNSNRLMNLFKGSNFGGYIMKFKYLLATSFVEGTLFSPNLKVEGVLI